MIVNIEGKITLITGADSGIGESTASFLADEGVTIILSDRKQDALDETIKELKKRHKGVKIIGITANSTKNNEILALAKKAKDAYGGAHIVINASGARGAAGYFLSLSDEDWMETIDVNLMDAVRIARAFIPQMQELNWGRMIMISSENAYQPYEEESPYNVCKAGIINF